LFVFKPKIPVWVNFGEPFNGKCWVYFITIWNILRIFGKCYDHLIHFVSIWYIFRVLVSRTNKNLATLKQTLIFNVPCRRFFPDKVFSRSSSRNGPFIQRLSSEVPRVRVQQKTRSLVIPGYELLSQIIIGTFLDFQLFAAVKIKIELTTDDSFTSLLHIMV
jgi:hypothetical protein